jgi:hypothetical protein
MTLIGHCDIYKENNPDKEKEPFKRFNEDMSGGEQNRRKVPIKL